MQPALRPVLTMSDIYGPGHFFFPRAVDGYSDWLPNDPHQLDLFTGGQLAVAGNMPVVCSSGFDSPVGAEMLALVGIEMAQNRIEYRAGEELNALSRAAAIDGGTAILSHALPAGAIEAERCWIDPALLAALNNKARLGEFATRERTPKRRVFDRAQYFATNSHELPIVLKAASDQSSGGGCAVAICRRPEDLKRAERLFASCNRIVEEELLDIVRNPCLNFAVMADGEVRYLGFADQEVTSEGKYRGNWLEAGSPISEADINAAAEPVRRSAALGYRGFAGVDLALTRDGRTYVLDLNFRANGCTTPLLLELALRDRHGGAVMHFRKLESSAGADELARRLRPFVAGGRVVPLNLFDARLAGYPDKPASVQALVLGSSRADVLAAEADIVVAIS